jgi:hypothetical protein
MIEHRHKRTLLAFAFLAGSAPAVASSNVPVSFDTLTVEYDQKILPLLKQFCLKCHSTEDKKGELDLERFQQLADVRRDPPAWQKVVQMLTDEEMPPKKSRQPSPEQKQQLLDWVRSYLNAEAQANAGDPGPVLLRRLNNAELAYTVTDLTGIPLDPAREFPVDGAAGEGFTNTGNALVMSPALVTKYLDAAKEIAGHAVLLPDGIRFSSGTTRRDWTDEILTEIRVIYLRHTGHMGDVNSLNRWDVADPQKLTNDDGRVDLARYIAGLIKHRSRLLENVDVAETVARDENLNPRYLEYLARMLVSDRPESILLDRIRRRWSNTSPQDAPAIAAEIRTWQDRLWKFNTVGHFGSIRPWQEPVRPIEASQTFRTKIEIPPGGNEITLYMVAGSAGDGNTSDVVVWQNPRLERAGRPSIRLRDLRAASVLLDQWRTKTLAATSSYLAATFDARTNEEGGSLAKLAAAYNVDPTMLDHWLTFLGISHDGEVKITEYLHHPLKQVGGYESVKGWTLPGVEALSLISNSSDTKLNVPGTMNPHHVAVHPRPERWVAAGWRSPTEGTVQLAPRVKDAHGSCGNGVSWSFELRRGAQRRVLAAGNLDLNGETAIEPLREFPIKKGDLVSLVIDPRDRNHGCDMTEIDLTVTEEIGEKRTWSLSGDCADSIDAGNPHADAFGNPAIWHFYTGLIEDDGQQPAVPADSLLAHWFNTADPAKAEALASQIQALVTQPLPKDAPTPTADLHHQLTALDGPLFSLIDPKALADSVTPDQLRTGVYGLDPQRFGRHPDGTPAATEDLIVQAPSILEVKLPASLVAGADFVVAGTLSLSDGPGGSVQFQVATTRPSDVDSLLVGVPIVVHKGSPTETRFSESMDQFRELFPAAMCYPKIVPVDEVVTLVLFHREDEHLARLMLDDAEKVRLDRLWDELHYVSQDALTIVTVFEQLLAFASQDDDPSRFEPLGESINNRAEAFRARLVTTEPVHIDALLDIAATAYRRPLTDPESKDLRNLYQTLRQQDMPHDAAIRLMLARVFAAPAFLYRLEKPGPGAEPAPISDRELASRLSYFLWSSMPDRQLRETAAAGRLRDPEILTSQMKRMLRDDRTRRLAIQFACQWLHIRDFDQLDEKSERHFPEFAGLREAMYEESILFFTDLFQNDGSVLSILDADHTFLNESLAKHYGIPGVQGEPWRRVDGVKEFSRGGILAQATTLSKQSGASRTSAILRGNWVSETLLGEKLPRPPSNIPQLPDTVPEGLTERQLIEQHSSQPSCAKCHVRIDPYGFALENFDAIGRFRENANAENPINTKATLMDGTSIEGMRGLRDYLLTTRRETFVRQFCRKLLGYALGRAVQLTDEPLLDKMVETLGRRSYSVYAAVELIIRSRQFREIRGKDSDNGSAQQ